MAKSKKVVGVLEHDRMSNTASQLATLNKRLEKFKKLNVRAIQTNIVCGNCEESITWPNASLEKLQNFEQVASMGKLNQHNKPYSNTYNPSWRNYCNFSWRNNQGAASNPPQCAPPERSHQ